MTPGAEHLTVHDSTEPGQLTVHDPPQYMSMYMTPRPGHLTVHDSSGQDTSPCMTPGPGYFTVHDSPGQDTSLCMTSLTRILHCA